VIAKNSNVSIGQKPEWDGSCLLESCACDTHPRLCAALPKFRFMEKGGKYNEVFAHHNAEAYLDAYLEAAGIWDEKKAPLFRTIDRKLQLSDRQLHRTDALRMVKRRALAAGLPASTCNHTFRATGITTYLKNGGRVEIAQQIAGHESARTTGLYDRRDDETSLDEVERIVI